MLHFFSKYKFFGIVLFVLSVLIVLAIYQVLKKDRVLPIYQPSQFDAALVDSTKQHIKKYHTIADFRLVNQNGDTITQDHYKDKIYVADFFFTTCQTICPIMTEHMAQLQKELKEEQNVLLLSHTVTPEIDTVAQLKRYALKKGVNDKKWNLVTGEKKHIYDLARKSYLVAKDEPYTPYGLIHTENFVLIDKKKQIRGTYDGTDPEAIAQLLEDIQILQKEK